MQPYGGFWVRVVAYVIDAVIINVTSSIVGLILGMGLAISMSGSGNPAMEAASVLTGGVAGFVISWLYFAILECSAWQATVGKKAMGLVVTDMAGRRIGFGRATGRYFAKILSTFILMIGFMMAGWTARRQGLHDMLAGTLVYKARAGERIGADASVFE